MPPHLGTYINDAAHPVPHQVLATTQCNHNQQHLLADNLQPSASLSFSSLISGDMLPIQLLYGPVMVTAPLSCHGQPQRNKTLNVKVVHLLPDNSGIFTRLLMPLTAALGEGE